MEKTAPASSLLRLLVVLATGLIMMSTTMIQVDAALTYIEAFDQMRVDMVWPVPNSPRTWELSVQSTFGPRAKAGTDGQYDFHRGVDIHGTVGDPLVAIYDGKVVKIATYYGGGLTLILEHAFPDWVTLIPANPNTKRWYSFHLHMDSTHLQEGASVKAGEEIGKLGESGANVYQPHLHQEIRVGTRCSLEYALNNPSSTCNTKGYDPHVHPFLVYEHLAAYSHPNILQESSIQAASAVSTPVRKLGGSSTPRRFLRNQQATSRELETTSDGTVAITSHDDQPNLNCFILTHKCEHGQTLKTHKLDLNQRIGFDASSTDAIDTPDTTQPYLSPITFGHTADYWDTRYVIPSSWVGFVNVGDYFELTTVDVQGIETTSVLGATPSDAALSGVASCGDYQVEVGCTRLSHDLMLDKPRGITLELLHASGLLRTCEESEHGQDASKVACEDFHQDPSTPPPSTYMVRATKENDDSKVYFLGMVAPGGRFELVSYDGPNKDFDSDVTVSIFDMDNNPIQIVSFHTSNSQPIQLMDAYGTVMVVGFTNPTQGTVSHDPSCVGLTPIHDATVCVKNPTEITLRVDGGTTCAESNHTQADRVVCTDYSTVPAWNSGEEVLIVIYIGGHYTSARIVEIGDFVTIQEDDGSTIASRTKVEIRDKTTNEIMQEIEFESDCSDPLRTGDRYGSLQVISYANADQGYISNHVDVQFEYTFSNAGGASSTAVLDDAQVTRNDDSYDVEVHEVVQSNETIVIRDVVRIDPRIKMTYQTTALVEEHASHCQVSGTHTLTVGDPTTSIQDPTTSGSSGSSVGQCVDLSVDVACSQLPRDACIGKPQGLTLEFEGLRSCANSDHSQKEEKVVCTDYAHSGTQSEYTIRATKEGDDDKVYFSGVVSAGGRLPLVHYDGDPTKDFDSDLTVSIFDSSNNRIQIVTFHTSSSEPIHLLDRYGSFKLVSFTNKDQGTILYAEDTTTTSAHRQASTEAPTHAPTNAPTDAPTQSSVSAQDAVCSNFHSDLRTCMATSGCGGCKTSTGEAFCLAGDAKGPTDSSYDCAGWYPSSTGTTEVKTIDSTTTTTYDRTGTTGLYVSPYGTRRRASITYNPSCSAIEPIHDATLCVKNPTEIILRVDGGRTCDQGSSHIQADKVICSDHGAVPSKDSREEVIVVVYGGNTFYAVHAVVVGDVVSVRKPGGGTIASSTRVVIQDKDGLPLQDVTFKTDCADPLRLGDTYGSLEVISYTNNDQGTVSNHVKVEFEYTFTNTGTDAAEVGSAVVKRNGEYHRLSSAPVVDPNEVVVVRDKVYVDTRAANPTGTTEDSFAVDLTCKVDSTSTEVELTSAPTKAPMTDAPTKSPTQTPTRTPTDVPTKAPTTDAPTKAPTTDAPTKAPTTDAPTSYPTKTPCAHAHMTDCLADSNCGVCKTSGGEGVCVPGDNTGPSSHECVEWYHMAVPTSPPTSAPTKAPTTDAPTKAPTTDAPTKAPTTDAPTKAPTTDLPTKAPTTDAPTKAPTTDAPTKAPTTDAPTKAPTTDAPTKAPTTDAPTNNPTETPCAHAHMTDCLADSNCGVCKTSESEEACVPGDNTGPSSHQCLEWYHMAVPTPPPTDAPTKAPTTDAPTRAPTTDAPTKAPTTDAPTKAPTTDAPTNTPTNAPTNSPTAVATEDFIGEITLSGTSALSDSELATALSILEGYTPNYGGPNAAAKFIAIGQETDGTYRRKIMEAAEQGIRGVRQIRSVTQNQRRAEEIVAEDILTFTGQFISSESDASSFPDLFLQWINSHLANVEMDLKAAGLPVVAVSYFARGRITARPTSSPSPTSNPTSTPTTTPTSSPIKLVPQCKAWCNRDRRDWTTKCSLLRECDACRQCSSSTTTTSSRTRTSTRTSTTSGGSCKRWCNGSRFAWSTKCRWSQCGGCGACS